MKKGDNGMKVFGVIVILAIIGSVFGGVVSAEDVSGGLEQSVDDAQLFDKNKITEQQKQQEILNMVNSHRGSLPAELILAIIRSEGGEGAFHIDGWNYNACYRERDGPWAQPTNGDGIMQVTTASGYHERSGPYTHDWAGYDHAINDGCDYLLAHYNTYCTHVQSTLHYNTGPNSLYIYLGKNWGDRDYLSHVAGHLSNFVPNTYGLQNQNLVNALNQGQNILDKYLHDMSIATGQSVGYYESYQTQLDSELHNIEVPNQPPTAIIDSITTDPAVQGSDTVSFTGHGTDPDGTVEAYNWSSSIDGSLSTSAAFTKPASELSVGTLTFYLKVQDNDGSWSSEDTEDLTINPANVAPTAIIDSITPDSAEQGTDTVTFTGHGTDPDGTVEAYNWRSSIDGQLSTSAACTKPASELSVGTHTFYFKVQDDDGAWSTEDTEDLTIYPANVPPTAIIDSITPDPAVQGSDTVSFTGHGTDACFSNWDYPSTSMATEKIPVEVDISNPHGVKSAWLHYDYGDDGSEDGVTQMSLISVRGAKTEIRGGSSSGLGVKAQKIAVSESAPLSGGGGSGVAEREGIQKSIYLYDAKTCKDVDISYPYGPIGVTTVFSPTDSVSYTWLQFNDIWSSHTVKWEWYDPNGNFYVDCTDLISDPSDSGYDHWDWYICCCGIYINGDLAAEEEGIWTVKVYLDGGQIETLYFNIEYIISDYTMCKNVQASSPYDPIERTSTFLSDDEIAVSWLRLDDVTNSLNVKWDWYDPSGNLYGTWDTDTSEPEEGCYLDWVKAYCSLYIKDHAAAEKPGEWVVKVYIDDEYKFEEEFTIYPDDARYKCEIPAPGMDYAGDEVSFYVSAYDVYDTPTDSAKHLLVIYVPGDPTLSFSPSSHDFGDKCEGETDNTTFELWNSGTDTLTYSLSKSCSWLEVNPTGGSSTGEHATITVDIDTTGLSEGTHTCDITINSNDGGGTFTVTVTVVPYPESSWTYMVYLDGDNNLEFAAIDDFLEMSSVGSTSDVNIVVQFDRIPSYSGAYGDWKTCKRFLVTPGMTPTAASAISDLGECNMGDPNTLRDFVEWTTTEFPADNYALILWNHGDGWKSINNWVPWADDDLKDTKDAGSSRGICVDNTNSDYLTLQETEDALTGKYVQLLGYDACLMHMVEVVYQVMTNAGVSVGSEEVEPGDGWPYDTILADLTVTPTMTENALGTVIVDRYMGSYGYTGSETQSAVDNLELPNLVTAVDNLAQALMTEINGGHVADVQQARSETEEIYYNYYIDLYHFAEKIQLYVPGAAAQAQAVMNSVGVAVYEEAHGTSVPNDHGLSIYYPRVEGVYLASYDSTAFAIDTQWNEFLKRYYNPPTQGGDIAYVHNGAWSVSTNGDNIPEYSFWFGFSGDLPVVGDINQDGLDDIAYVHNGAWSVSTNGDNIPEYSFWFGFPGETPVVGDINQDGLDDIAYVHNGAWSVSTNGDNIPEYSFWFGFPGDIPVVGDINQDGLDDIAYFHDGAWCVSTNADNIPEYCFWFGFPGDIPVVGDINQDELDDIAYFHDGAWCVSTNADNIPEYYFWFGFAGDIPVVGNIG